MEIFHENSIDALTQHGRDVLIFTQLEHPRDGYSPGLREIDHLFFGVKHENFTKTVGTRGTSSQL